jgi:hypothetical protein
MKRQALGSAMALLLLLAVGSCALAPVSIGSVPVYPDAKGLTAEQNNLAGQVRQAMTVSAEEQGLSAKFRLYALPEGATWDSVVAYYTGELAGTDWQPAPELNSHSDVFTGLGWTQGGAGKEQSLLVVYVPDLLSDGAHLVVGVLSE